MIKKPRIIEKTCLCGCGTVFFQDRYNRGYVLGHSQKITRKLMIGNKAPGWHGGIRKHRGYIEVFSPGHPAVTNTARSPYVKRSRLEMEKKLGRYLETTEIVHHINGARDDDRIENLVLLTRSAHQSIHTDLKGRWSKKFDQCQKCGAKEEASHFAFGLCTVCYHKEWYSLRH